MLGLLKQSHMILKFATGFLGMNFLSLIAVFQVLFVLKAITSREIFL